ncbi:methyl-accepting chemotaxis protein [Photobacterium sp. SDRW27]|uniref:methyl-accepting chemotaxis protein n=1 Tax=Photobacterium obscurum TaxID=2829490 RepID=UPI002244127D|nr:methyl-accepting chemotaxis protein [Photobacterium obscurum]MCW8329986.1 methyl-accepting chemotaxis protein [Photobacterium obscurum]
MSKFGFKARIITTIAILISLILIATNFYSYIQFRDDKTASINHLSTLLADEAKQKIESWIQQKISVVESSTKFFNEYHPDAEMVATARLLTEAAKLASFTAGYEHGGSYSEGGVSEANEYDPRTRDWYKDARSADHTILTDIYNDFYTKKPMVSIASPIDNGVVLGDITIETIQHTVEEIQFPGAVAMILDRNFVPLASTDPEMPAGSDFNVSELRQQIIGQTSGSAEYERNGSERVAFFNTIQLLGDNQWYIFISVDKSVAYAEVDKALNSGIVALLLSILIGVTVVVLLLNRLYQPIVALKETIVDLSQGNGDLTRRLTVNSSDDLGQIAEGVNTFVNNLQHMMLEVMQATQHISGGISQLHNQAELNNTILQSHTAETEQVVTAVEEMSSTASTVAQSASQAAGYTQEANQEAQTSKSAVGQAVAGVNSLVEEVESMESHIHNMNEDTQQINSVLTVIGGIAEQTNLLALNAAIEAARAGEQGRGFAVVADEVRALAGRTQQSTAEIAEMLAKLTSGSETVVAAMDKTKQKCRQTATDTEQVHTSLDTMNNSVEEINDISNQIATAAEEQSSVSVEISRNMSAISEMVSELSSNSESAVDSAQALAAANAQLARIVAQFKLS